MNWIQTLNSAIEYMEDHLNENITPKDVAQSVFLSEFHLQRVFTMMTGRTVGEYMRNRKLTLAGAQLQNSRDKVTDIAYQYGYETPESFTKAFKRFHGITPLQAKCMGADLKSFSRLTIKIVMEGGNMMDYKIVEKESFTVVAKTRLFTDEESIIGIPAFWSEYFSHGLQYKVCGAMGICSTLKNDSSAWQYGIGAEKLPEYVKEIPEDFEIIQIPAYTWAIFRCVGPMPLTIQNMWKRIYGEWLPQSGYELIQEYDIEFYTEGDNSSADYVSEIWIPVKKIKL